MSKTATTRQFRAAIRHWRKACRELADTSAGNPERIGEVLELDREWRELGKQLESQMSEESHV